MTRAMAGLTALPIRAAPALQFGPIRRNRAADGAGVAATAWRFRGVFTVLTNIAAAIASALALRPGSVPSRPA
ncbi:MAG: hypothetical protein R3D85_13705 [Paracoccaceae bacterium]